MRPLAFASTLVSAVSLAAAALAADEMSEAEMALWEQVSEKQPDEFVPVVTETMIEIGCTMDMNDPSEFEETLAAKVADEFGHEGELSPIAVESISFALRGTGLLMVGMGAIRIDDEKNTGTLIDCEAAK